MKSNRFLNLSITLLILLLSAFASFAQGQLTSQQREAVGPTFADDAR